MPAPVGRKARGTTDGIAGRFNDERVPVWVTETRYDAKTRKAVERTFEHTADEGPRPDTTVEALARLTPAFKVGGTVTAGNASQMNDGAAASVIMTKRMVEELRATPIARMLGFAVAGVAAGITGIGPINAIPKVLKQVGLSISNIDLMEVNEAFASQSAAIVRELGFDPGRTYAVGAPGRRRSSRMAYSGRKGRSRIESGMTKSGNCVSPTRIGVRDDKDRGDTCQISRGAALTVA